MRKNVYRENHEFKVRAKDKQYNPMKLENKCFYIMGGYIKSTKNEELQRKRGANAETIATGERLRVFASLFFQLETAGQVLDRTVKQWNTMMRKKWKWMGNVIMGEDSYPPHANVQYNKKSDRELEFMIHQIYGSQQIRTQSITSIDRSTISKSKKE